LPASAFITDWIAQMAYAIDNAPHRTINQRAVMEFTPFLLDCA